MDAYTDRDLVSMGFTESERNKIWEATLSISAALPRWFGSRSDYAALIARTLYQFQVGGGVDVDKL